VVVEDYCHAVEHSIEFQTVFLHHVAGRSVPILPILCGPFARCLAGGGPPEEEPPVRAFFEALSEIAAGERGRLVWLLGIDLAHVGARYGDGFAARADQGPLAEVAVLDRQRLESVCRGEREAFLARVQPGGDPLKWCGFSPLYTFLAALEPVEPGLSGRLLRYEQWNIDPQSVVSFAALAFTAQRAASEIAS
jgi:AmmeMemoRadiSam system protein B